MKIAALPFNAKDGSRPAIGRQFSNFICENVRMATGVDINSVSFLTQIEDADGPRAAFVNVADSLLDREWLLQILNESSADYVMDGMIVERDDSSIELTVRFHNKEQEEPVLQRLHAFPNRELFGVLQSLIKDLAEIAKVELPENLAGDSMDFGTDNPEAFLKFLEGYDALMYIQQTNGRVAREFSPEGAVTALISATQLDPDFLGPYETCVQLCRMCTQYQIGTIELVMDALKKLEATAPEDFRATYALGELYQAANDPAKAADAFEKAVKIAPEEPAIYTRLGLAQMAMNMPVNAERNLRRAVELEADDKPSMDYLAMVLQQTNRGHEVPALWKDLVAAQPGNAVIRAKYAVSLVQADKEQEGVAEFEKGLTEIEDNAILKRWFAPMLASKGELDRAMDYYEDCLDLTPTDVPLLLEYANTLRTANRNFEIPKVLRDVLALNPDQNTKAEVLAWLLELEQTKRTEAVEAAKTKMDAGDFDTAMTELRPLKNWLGDYWKMWMLLAAGHNRLNQFQEAEEAGRRLIDLFPGFEPGYGELGLALDSQGKFEEAYHLMRFAAMNLPQSLNVHVLLARAANRAGKKDEAVALAKQIREAVGPNKELEEALSEIDG